VIHFIAASGFGAYLCVFAPLRAELVSASGSPPKHIPRKDAKTRRREEGPQRRSVMSYAKSIAYFILAGLCEIGGGYLIWLWLREGKALWFGLVGAAILVLYGIVPTLQPSHFGRVYAAYGGVFIVLSILWGWRVDRTIPDRYDLIGGFLALAGVAVIMYWPRR
jgi:small multidrug resistance family-3 protein